MAISQIINTKYIESLVKKFKKDKNNTYITYLVVFVAVLVLVVFLVQSEGFPVIDDNTYQAVFLTNNQVYFGELKDYSDEYVILENIFYLQASDPLQQVSVLGSTDDSNINLVKLGDELHGPEDKMFIPKERILFWENLKTDSAVARAITAENN